MTAEPTVAISQDFLTAFARIPRSEQKRLNEFVTKFRHDPKASSINFERINDALDPNFRSVRIGQDYRGIVMHPEQGNVYVLLWVDKHDDAYDWARRHTCRVHPETGSLQVLATETLEAPQAASPEPIQADAKSLFGLRDREMARLGVPEEHFETVRAVSDERGLDHLEQVLPREAFEALYLLAAGSSYEEVALEYGASTTPVDPSDFGAALQRDQSQRSFAIIEDDAEPIAFADNDEICFDLGLELANVVVGSGRPREGAPAIQGQGEPVVGALQAVVHDCHDEGDGKIYARTCSSFLLPRYELDHQTCDGQISV